MSEEQQSQPAESGRRQVWCPCGCGQHYPAPDDFDAKAHAVRAEWIREEVP